MSEAVSNSNKFVLNDTDKTVIRIAVYTLGSAIIGSGLFFGIRTIVRHIRSNKEQNLSLSDDSSANYAKRLKLEFDTDGFWGTNVEKVRKDFSELPRKAAFTAV